ncbi:MAG: hypothetical protein ABW167_22270 [Baekduia sp.]
MSMRKRVPVALGAALAAGVLAAVALGQDVVPIQISATVTVTPDKAGTPSHPRSIRVDARGTIDTPDERAPLMPRSVDVWLPKGWIYNGAKRPACTLAKLRTSGPRACPQRSFISWSTSGIGDPNDLSPPPRVTVINGGRSKMYFWVVLDLPARVQTAVTGTLTKLSSPRWSYRLHADVPPILHVVSGIPIVVDSFHMTVREDDWIVTTHCPRDRLWRYHLRMTHTSGQVIDTGGSVPCRS